MNYFFKSFSEPFSYLLFFIGVLAYYRYTGRQHSTWLLANYLFTAVLMTFAAVNVITETSNIWMYNLAALAGTICIGGYYYRVLQSGIKKAVVLSLVSLYVVYAIFKNGILQEFQLFDSLGYAIVSVTVTIYVLMYFHQTLTNVTETNILGEFNFWLASAYLIYFAGSFIIFLSYYYLTTKILTTYTDQERELLTSLWVVHNMLLLFSALLLLTGSLWLTYRKKSALS